MKHREKWAKSLHKAEKWCEESNVRDGHTSKPSRSKSDALLMILPKNIGDKKRKILEKLVKLKAI